MAVKVAGMPKPRKRAADDPDPEPPKMFSLRLRAKIRKQLELLTNVNDSDLSEEIHIAIRERLERAGLWPPKSE